MPCSPPARRRSAAAPPSIRPIVVAALLVALASVLAAPLAATAATPDDTITFSGLSLIGVACGSGPDRSSLSIVAGTPVDLVNQTGYPATVEVDAKAVKQDGVNLVVASGAGTPLALDAGTWKLTLVPQCVLPVTQAATITVAGAGPVTTAPPVSPSPSAQAPPSACGPPQSCASASAAGSAPAAATQPAASATHGSAGARGTAGTPGSPDSGPSGAPAAFAGGASATSGGPTAVDAGRGAHIPGFLPWLLVALGVVLAVVVGGIAFRRGRPAPAAAVPVAGPVTSLSVAGRFIADLSVAGGPLPGAPPVGVPLAEPPVGVPLAELPGDGSSVVGPGQAEAGWQAWPSPQDGAGDRPPERPGGAAGWSWPAGHGN